MRKLLARLRERMAIAAHPLWKLAFRCGCPDLAWCANHWCSCEGHLGAWL